MKIKKFVFNPFQVNTYLVANQSNECLIIDPGCLEQREKEELSRYITDNNLTVKRVVATHLHLDHAFGCNFISREFGIQTEASQKDEPLLQHIRDYASAFGIAANAVEKSSLGGYLKEDDEITIGELTFKVMENPGHSTGGLLFYEKNEGVIFAGDSVFKGSIGRTDLPGGDFGQLVSNLKRNLFALPKETQILPGHGPSTSIDWERCHNPYLDED